MNLILTVLIFGFCFAGMALGVIFARKVLRKGCSMDPDSCACRNEEKKAKIDDSDGLTDLHPGLNPKK